MRLRIAVGGIHIESSTFTRYISDQKDFLIRKGAELLERYPWRKNYPDVEFVPLIHARALPGGVVSRAFADKWLKTFLELLDERRKEGPIDGLLFDIHGAMSMEGSDDAEGELLTKIREALGGNVPIATSMDLHGNVSDALFQATDVLTCYRTAPHIDAPETRERAFRQLLEIVRNKRAHLVRTKVDIPLLLPGEKTSTEVEPGKGLYAKIDEVVAQDKIMDCSIWMGFPWADQPRCHAVVAVTGYDKEKTEKEALKMAQAFWDARDEFAFVGPAARPAEAVKMALASEQKPYFISDTGDNPGAGGANDMVVLLQEFAAAAEAEKTDKKVLFASVKDEETVLQAKKHKPGDRIAVQLGGKIDPGYGGAFEAEAEILRFYEDAPSGPSVVLRTGTIDVIVTSRRHQFSTKKFFENAGVKEFTDYDIIVVKMGYLEPDLSRAQKGWVMALTPGAVDQDTENIPFKNLRTPLYPIQKEFSPNLKTVTVESLPVKS